MAAVTVGTSSGRSAGRGIRGERRAEMLTGLAFVFIPLLLYLFLYFGAMVYAAYISLWRWGLRGPARVPRGPQLRAGVRRPDLLEGRHEHAVLRRGLGPADDGPGPLPRGHRQPGPPRPDVLPGGVLLPDARELRGDHRRLDLPAPAGRAVQLRPGGGRAEPDLPGAGLQRQLQLAGQLANGDERDHPAQRLDHVRDVDALLPDVPAADQPRDLRGRRDRRRGLRGRRSGGSRSRSSGPPTSSSRRCS